MLSFLRKYKPKRLGKKNPSILTRPPVELDQPPVELDRLPIELYRPIIEWITVRADLHTLLFVSRIFRDEAERLLYHTIWVSNTINIQTRIQRFNHLAECDRVASYVRDLIIMTGYHHSGYNSILLTRYWLSLNRALCAINNLTSLGLQMFECLPAEVPAYPRFSLLSGCTFRLQSLTISGLRDLDRTAMEDQSAVERLYLIGPMSDHITFSPNAFKNLSTLCILEKPYLLPELVNGRRVKAIYSNNALTWPTIHSNSVTSLYTTHYSGDNPPNLHLIFPSLRYLRLSLSSANIFGFPRPIQQLAEMLSMLTRLQKLHLVGPDVRLLCIQPHPFLDQVASLQVLVIQVSAWRHEEWVRGVTSSTEIVFDDLEWADTRWH